MPKKVSVEIVRQPSPEDMKAMLGRLAREQVEQVMAERGTDELEPVYRNRRVRQVHPGFDREKHALYFEKWGCSVCGRKRGLTHMCNAKCERCNNRFIDRMKQLELEWLRNNPEDQITEDIDRLTRRLRSAREL